MNFKMFMICMYLFWGISGLCMVALIIQKIMNSVKVTKFQKALDEQLDEQKEKKAKRKLSKDTSKKQIKNHNKKKNTINFEALKFEYSSICEIVNVSAEKSGFFNATSPVYILSFDKYFKKKNSYNKSKFNGMYSLDTLACLVKALTYEPLIKGSNINETSNLSILEEVIKAFSVKGITYQNLSLSSYKKEELLVSMQENFRLYNDDIFLIAMYLIEKIM